RPDLADGGDDRLQAAPQEWLAAGEPHFLDPELADGDPDQADNLPVREDVVPGHPVETLLRHAVGTAEVAPVSERDPQISGHATEAVDQSVVLGPRRIQAASPDFRHAQIDERHG